MKYRPYPVIDFAETGANIRRLRESCGLTVRDVQNYFGFEAPQAIYKWESGRSLPNVDNLCALAELLGVNMDDIIIRGTRLNILPSKLRDESCGLNHFWRFFCFSRTLQVMY